MNSGSFLLFTFVLAASVQATRWLPFAVFKKPDTMPKTIEYLGSVLPAAIMGLLVVYCLKDTDFGSAASFIPALAASVLTAAVHLLKRNTILSISLGTAAYMLLIRLF